jgi:hypothetical protein
MLLALNRELDQSSPHYVSTAIIGADLTVIFLPTHRNYWYKILHYFSTYS